MFGHDTIARLDFLKAVAAAALVLCVGSPALGQSSYNVTSPDDEGGTDTLRWAIDQVNAGSGLDQVFIFQSSIQQNGAGIWYLAPDNDLPSFTKSTTIRLDTTTNPINVPVSIRLTNDISDDSTTNKNRIDIVGSNSQLNNLLLINTTFQANVVVLNNSQLIIKTEFDPISGDGFQAEMSTPIARDAGVSGTLIKQGLGELGWNGPSNSAIKERIEIEIEEGVLRGDTHSLQNKITIDPGAYLAYEMPYVYRFENPHDNPNDNFNGPGPVSSGSFAIDSSTTGGGTLLKTGTGTLTVLGELDHTGGTYILEGELKGDSDRFLGDPVIPGTPGTPAVVHLFHVCGVTDTPTLTNATDWNGDPYGCSDSAGILTFDQSDPASSGILDDTIRIEGTGILQKAGSNPLTLAADQTNWAGTFNVDAGSLVLQAELGDPTPSGAFSTMSINGGVLDLQSGGLFNGDVVIQPDGRLTGSGTGKIKGNVESSGRIGPTGAGPTAKIEIVGSFTSQTNSTYGANLDVDSGGNDLSNFVSVTGAATINDLVISVNATADVKDRAPLRTFELIGAGDIPVLNARIDSNSQAAAYTYSIDSDTTTCPSGSAECMKLRLAYQFQPTAQFAQTGNTRSFARSFDAAGLVACPTPPQHFCIPGDDLGRVYDEFQGEGGSTITQNNMTSHLDDLDGDELHAFSEVRMAGANRFHRSIARRFDLESSPKKAGQSRTLFGPRATPLPSMRYLQGTTLGLPSVQHRGTRPTRRRPGYLADDDINIGRRPGNPGWTAWADFKGIFGEIDDDDASDIDYTIYGPLIGLDFGLGEHITVGGTLGYTRDEYEADGSSGKGTADTYQAGLYAGAAWKDAYIVASVRYAYSDMETRRTIRFNSPQLPNRKAYGDFDGDDWSGFIEASWGHQFESGVKVQPMVSLTYHHLEQNSFTEAYADSLDLSVPKQTLNAVVTQLGTRVGFMGRPKDTIYVYPQLRVSWEHDWNDLDRNFALTMPRAAGSTPFEVEGAGLPDDRIVLGISTETGITEHLNAFLDYDARVWEDFAEHSVALGFRFTF